MFTRRSYSIRELLYWTRREILFLILLAVIPTVLYAIAGWKWLIIPWVPIALIGTAVAFVIGFKNNASYDRMWEGRRAFGGIVNASRAWGVMVKDYVVNRPPSAPVSETELREIHRRLI